MNVPETTASWWIRSHSSHIHLTKDAHKLCGTNPAWVRLLLSLRVDISYINLYCLHLMDSKRPAQHLRATMSSRHQRAQSIKLTGRVIPRKLDILDGSVINTILEFFTCYLHRRTQRIQRRPSISLPRDRQRRVIE